VHKTNDRVPVFLNSKTKNTFAPIDGAAAFATKYFSGTDDDGAPLLKPPFVARALLYPSKLVPQLSQSLKCNAKENMKVTSTSMEGGSERNNCLPYFPDFESFTTRKEIMRTHKRLMKTFGEDSRTIHVVYIGSVLLTYSAAFAFFSGTCGRVGVYAIALLALGTLTNSGKRDGAVPLPGLFIISALTFTSMIFGRNTKRRRTKKQKTR
jgi:hypothetical protein